MTIHKYTQCDRKGCKNKYHEEPQRNKLYDYKGWLTFYKLSSIEGDVMPEGKTHYCSESCLRWALGGQT